MEKLPQLALDLVCEYLGLSEPHKASLLAFASASRVCRAAAWRERFSQLSIDVDHPKFDEKLKILESILDETKGRACVKVLKLGVCNHDQTEPVDDKTQGVHASCAKFGSNFHPKHPFRERKWKKGRGPDEFWQSLAQFISSLHLKEVIWASTEQIPRCIIAVLNQQIPACRLHVHGFDLHSLHQREILQDVEEMDYMLATSPCLYSICAPYSLYDESGCANYNGEAVLQLSAGFAPSLKHVCVWRTSTMPSGEIRARRNARLEWRGFHPQSESEWHEIPESKGQIQSLAIDDFYMVPGSQLASWERHVDFSVLQSLHLARQIELVVLQRLADIAEQDGLPRLKSLNLPAISCEYEELIDAESTMTRLCASLHPLVELGIVGPRTKSFEAILQRHGDALQVFCIQDFILSAHQVLQLRESCPRVRTLNVEILRSAGDHVEIGIYQTLGSLRNLKSLSVILKCTDYRHGDGLDEPVILMMPSGDEEDQEAMEIAIRQVFVNAAVDASLAQAIFQQILAAHASVKAGLRPMLDCIRLQVGTVSVLNNQMMNEDFKGVLAWIGRSWICRRDPRDTHQNDVTIEEVDRDTRLCNGKRLEDDMEELSGSEQYADVWKALWPDTAAGWKEAWQSFPLANDVETFKDTKIFINFQTGERGKES